MRKELLKPSINKNFSHLYSASIPVTNELFGSDLSKQIRDLSETNKSPINSDHKVKVLEEAAHPEGLLF